MGEISYDDKMQIQTIHEIGFGYGIIVANFSEKNWNLSCGKSYLLIIFL